MPYFHVGDDWDGLGALGADPLIVAAPQMAMSAIRRAAPAGSVVPTIRGRRPAGLRMLTPMQSAAIVTARRRTIARLGAIRRAPSMQLKPLVATFKGFTDPQVFAGFGATDEGGVEALRSLSGTLQDALAEIDGLGLSGNDQTRLGSTLLGQRTGDIAAALGIDVAWQDLVQNAGGEFARLRQDLGGLGIDPGNLLSSIGFEHISAVFADQGMGVASLSNLAASARDLYDRHGSEVMNLIVGHAGAFSEGGLRRMVEEVLGGASTSRWLTGENLQRLGGVAQAWVGAGTSGSASGYVTAVGSTIAAVGTGLAAASVAVPVGTIVAAVGAVITLLATLLGDEQPPPPPEIRPCEGPAAKHWRRNPEAWTALSMWLVAKDGKFFDSDYYKDAERRGVLVQQIVAEAGWFATIDRYTGEVMVRAPSAPGVPAPMRRLLDAADRRDLQPTSDSVDVFDRMRAQFGLKAQGTPWGETNMLWCQPNPLETLTRFFGAEQYRVKGSSSGGWTSPFRSDPDDRNTAQWDQKIGGGVPWDGWIGNDQFWRAYTVALQAAMYLGGTVPYGARRLYYGHGGQTHSVGISTGVGGDASNYPIEVRWRHGTTFAYDNPLLPIGSDSFGLWLPDHAKIAPSMDDGEAVSWDELPARIADQEWRLRHRVPVPSPEQQTTPGDAVARAPIQRCSTLASGQRICALLPRKELRPLTVFKRSEKTALSRGTKIALWTAGGVLLVGGGYAGWRYYQRRRGG